MYCNVMYTSFLPLLCLTHRANKPPLHLNRLYLQMNECLLLLISNLHTGCFSTALNCFKSQQWFSLNVLQRQHCCLTSIHISFNCFLCICVLNGTLFACFVALFYKDFLMALRGHLAFIVECFIQIHVHCIMCFTEVFGLHCGFLPSYVYL